MIDWWAGELAELPNVTVHLGTEISADSAELSDADEIIVAAGSHPLHPPIPGLDKPIVTEVIDAHTGGEPPDQPHREGDHRHRRGRRGPRR